jgi:hypothetical protein
MDNERDTHSYVLVGGDNLQAHLGKRVEVVGTLSGKSQDMEQGIDEEDRSGAGHHRRRHADCKDDGRHRSAGPAAQRARGA